MIKRLVAVLLVGCFLSGCVALPYATPPVEYAGGIGVAAQDAQARLAVPVRGTLHPAGLFKELYKRNWDLGAGYTLLLPINATFYHGPNVSVGWFETFPTETGPTPNMWRVGVAGLPGLAFDAEKGELGYVVTGRVTGEYVSWADGAYTSCNTAEGCAIGYAYGETSAGLFAEVSYWNVDPQIWTVSFGLLFRAPATVGVLFAWLIN